MNTLDDVLGTELARYVSTLAHSLSHRANCTRRGRGGSSSGNSLDEGG